MISLNGTTTLLEISPPLRSVRGGPLLTLESEDLKVDRGGPLLTLVLEDFGDPEKCLNNTISPRKTLKNPNFFLARFARQHLQKSWGALINSHKSFQSDRGALIEGGAYFQ